MTNLATTSTHTMVQESRHLARHSDGAPMVVTRLSGWIDIGETNATTPSWIIRTRTHESAR